MENGTMDVKRGDIFFVRKGKGSVEGSEQDAERPAVVVSNDIGNQYAPIVEVVYLTTQEKKPMPTHVNVMCRVPSIALCEQVHTVYKDRLSDYIRTCTEKEMAHIDSALMTSLGLAEEEDLKEKLNDTIDELELLKSENAKLKASGEAKRYVISDKGIAPLGESEKIIELKTKCELYKEQYESLLAKVLRK